MCPPRTILGRYLLLERIGVGGMAEVFRAREMVVAGEGRLVAVKRLLPDLAGDAASVQMFLGEARTTSRLRHPGICEVLDYGQAGGTCFLALELVEGKDLRRILEYHRIRGRPVPLAFSLHILCCLCAALDYAHTELGIVHRDVSPPNILVAYDGQVKLIDFGVAKLAAGPGNVPSTTVHGKLPYLSPEQVEGGPVDRRSDLFACGTLLYEMLTQRSPFRGRTPGETLDRVRRAQVQLPSRVRPGLPAVLDRVLQRALARSPAHRYGSAAELRRDLEQVATGTGGVGSQAELARWMDEVFGGDRRRAEARKHEAERDPQDTG